MLKITIELHNAATGQTTLLGQATIANNGTRTNVATFSKWAPKEKGTWKKGDVKDFAMRYAKRT